MRIELAFDLRNMLFGVLQIKNKPNRVLISCCVATKADTADSLINIPEILKWQRWGYHILTSDAGPILTGVLCMRPGTCGVGFHQMLIQAQYPHT